MKKTVFLASAAILTSLVVGAGQAFAAEGDPYPTNGTISFTKNDDPTPPVDPENPDPENPVDPEEPPTPTGGALSIDYASYFKFGEQKISTKTETYYAGLDKFKDDQGNPTIEKPNYVQVTDKRGTLGGWTLSVQQLEQFKTSENNELTGAELSISSAKVVGVAGTEAYTPQTVSSSLTLVPGQETPAITAEKDKEGAGTWVYRFGDNNEAGKTAVKLVVPGKTLKLAKEYKAQINWTLAAIPGNGGEEAGQ